MHRRLGAIAVLAALSTSALLLGVSASAADPGAGIPVQPVHGQALGNGVRLYVDVFYARGGNPGPPGGGGGGGGGGGTSAPDCTRANDDSQTGYATPFANANARGLELKVNAANQPTSGVNDFVGALETAAASWNTAANHTVFSVNPNGGASRPTQDAISTVGWLRLVPKNVLAATWTYVDSSNTIIETDTFFNTSYTWTDSMECPLSADGTFVVQNIATHEFGHSLGLSHYSDAGAQATMYPSAPPNETRKITLTEGDIAAVMSSLGS